MAEGTDRQKQTPKHTRPLANSWSVFISLSNSYNIKNMYVLITLSEIYTIFPFQYSVNFVVFMSAEASSHMKPASAGDLERFETLL
jgi:hypothetical protein